MVVVTPSVTPRCFYMDFRDGSEKWESFLVGPFLDHLRGRFNVRTDRRGPLVTGIYRLYHGADHVGRVLGPRAAYAFLGGTLLEGEPDPVVNAARQRIDPLKRRLDEADHYGVDEPLIGDDP